MANLDLLQALNCSVKHMKQEAKDDAEIDFIKKHRSRFAEDRATFNDALKSMEGSSGQALLNALNYSALFIEKVKESELLSFCYNPIGSKLLKRFEEFERKCKGDRNVTAIFVVGVHAIVVSCNDNLQADGTTRDCVMNFIARADKCSISWSAIENLRKDFHFYDSKGSLNE